MAFLYHMSPNDAAFGQHELDPSQDESRNGALAERKPLVGYRYKKACCPDPRMVASARMMDSWQENNSDRMALYLNQRIDDH